MAIKRSPPANGQPLLIPVLREVRSLFARFSPVWVDERRRRIRFAIKGSIQELASVGIAAATKGDLMAWSGSRFVRVPVGSDGDVLTASSSSKGGINYQTPSGGGSGGESVRDTLRSKRVFLWSAVVDAGSVKGLSGLDIQRSGSGGAVKVWSSAGGFLRTDTALGIGAMARWHRNGNNTMRMIHLEADPGMTWRIKTSPSIANALYFIGMSSGQPTNSASGGTKQFLVFRYLAGTDTYWTAMSNDGSTQTVTASTTTVLADTVYDLSIDYDSAAGVATFKVNNTDPVTISTNIPTVTVLMGIEAIIFNNPGGAPAVGLGLSSACLEIK